MTNKIAELHRINDPRVEKIVKMLDVIQKSGKSLRVHELDMVQLLTPVTHKLDEVLDRDAVAFEKTGELAPEPPLPDTPIARQSELHRRAEERAFTKPIAREALRLENMDTQQLVDVMIAAGALLAERRQ